MTVSRRLLCIWRFSRLERGLEARLIYARYIDGEWLPDDVRKLGEKWIYGKLSRKEIEELRKKFITEHIFDRWCGGSK
jgi:hypothetical protein